MPSAPLATSTTSMPLSAALAGLVPWAVSGISTRMRCVLATRLVVGADHLHADELALGARPPAAA